MPLKHYRDEDRSFPCARQWFDLISTALFRSARLRRSSRARYTLDVVFGSGRRALGGGCLAFAALASCARAASQRPTQPRPVAAASERSWPSRLFASRADWTDSWRTPYAQTAFGSAHPWIDPRALSPEIERQTRRPRMEFVVAHGPLDAEQTLAAALSLDDPDAAPLRDPLGALLRDDCPRRASSVHERAGRQWRCGALESVRVLAAAGTRSTVWRRYRDEVRDEVVLPGVLADRVVALSSCVQDEFRAGRDREAFRCARGLGALLERVSPPELREAPSAGSRDWVTRKVGGALRWARATLDRLQSPSAATHAAAHENGTQRVERLVRAAMECTTRARPPFVAPCPPLDELEAMGDEAVAPLIDAIERDERSLRIGAWSDGGLLRYEFVPAPVREALFPIVSARIRVETTAHTLFYQRAPGPPVAAALRLAWNAQSHRSAAALDADDWSSSSTPCAAIDAIAQRWLYVPRLPWQPRVQFAPIIVSAVVRAAVVANSAAIARRCDGAINPLVLLALVDLAHAPLLAAAVYEATSVKSDELFEAASFVLAHSEDPLARAAFALRHFESSDRSLDAIAARLDVLGPARRSSRACGDGSASPARARPRCRRAAVRADRSDGTVCSH
jgi:hypothetical protein